MYFWFNCAGISADCGQLQIRTSVPERTWPGVNSETLSCARSPGLYVRGIGLLHV